MKSALSSNSLSGALRLVMAGSLVLVASACAVEQKCPLGTNDHYCTTVKDTYEAARSGGGSKDNVNQPVGNGKKGDADRLDMAAGRHNLAGPVYNPGKPYRLWVAPWTDANGIVHSGEMLYFATPARFNYGPLDLPGSASGVMGPAVPSELGFVPVEKPKEDTSADGVTPPSPLVGGGSTVSIPQK